MNKYILVGAGVLALVIGRYVHRGEAPFLHEAKDRRTTHEKMALQPPSRGAGHLAETQGAFRPGGKAFKTNAAGAATDVGETGQRLDRRGGPPSVIVQDKVARPSSAASSSGQEVVASLRTDEEAEEKTFDQWIVQLSDTDTKARDEALVALKQCTADEAAPKLKALMEQTEDQQLKAALQEAITFIELPEYTPPKRLSTRGPAVGRKAARAMR
jgi:hypothetical protein